MSFIRRRAKRSFDKFALLRMAMEELGFKKLPKLPCKRTRNYDMVDINKCVTRCPFQCKAFLNFDYILNYCESEDCSSEATCPNCLEEIEKNKVLFRCLKILANTDVEKPRKPNHQMKYYRKRSRRGIENE